MRHLLFSFVFLFGSFHLFSQEVVLPDTTNIRTLDRHFDDSTILSLQENPLYNYNDDPRFESNPLKKWWKRTWQKFNRFMEEATSPIVWKIIRFIIIVGSILAMAYILTRSRRTGFLAKDKGHLAPGEVIFSSDNFSSQSFNDLISSFEEQENYREAFRYQFLRMLKFLQEKEVIQWNPKMTNRELLMNLPEDAFKNSLGELVQKFEYYWYGEHPFKSADDYYQLITNMRVILESQSMEHA